MKRNNLKSTVYLIHDPTEACVKKTFEFIFFNTVPENKQHVYAEFQALFNDIILKYTNSSTFKALKIVKSNSSTFKVFKHPYEPCREVEKMTGRLNKVIVVCTIDVQLISDQ